jgi:hypothetical protein
MFDQAKVPLKPLRVTPTPQDLTALISRAVIDDNQLDVRIRCVTSEPVEYEIEYGRVISVGHQQRNARPVRRRLHHGHASGMV